MAYSVASPRNTRRRATRRRLTSSSGAWRAALKTLQKPVEHQRRVSAHVEPELELPEVLGKVLLAHMNVRAVDGVFETAPEAFDAVGMVDAFDVLPERVLHEPMLVSELGEIAIGQKAIGADRGTLGDVLLDQGKQGLALGVGDDASNDIPVALDSTEHDGLVLVPVMDVGPIAADQGFVHLDMPGQAGIPVHVGHVLADFMPHAPGGLVGHAKLPLKLLGRDTVPGRGKEVHGIEPLLERGMGSLKGRPRHRMNLMAAPRTLVGRNLLNPRELPMLAALRAVHGFAVPNRHQMVQATRIVRKLLKEVIDSKGRSFHCWPLVHVL